MSARTPRGHSNVGVRRQAQTATPTDLERAIHRSSGVVFLAADARVAAAGKSISLPLPPTSRPVGIRDGRQRDSMTRGRLRYDERCAASGRTTSPMSLSMQAPHQLPGRSELIPSRLPRCHRLALHSLQNWLTASASWADANSNAAADRGLVPHCINKLIRPSTLIGVHVYNITAMKNVAPPATTFAGRQHHAHAPQHYRAAPLHYTNQHDRDKSRQMPPINSRSQILTTRIP
ncbi:uncharacterized protein SEPMUDRAFT_118077 [Sphaerulina musiva SO2202]|uniref:Uncharacterized protein n=1 Tax=Sphaerulina musiva (strain SO2202) TaxID=692275 RepID=N1QFU6_SPHMS|nr:uncharacterized protein SEPMUDRAFT_118077 [Sphaerulina musiva SO2202]EMF12132.1 hypothetical protein SEPMUDRAFT_118077 [Sphaerulina musiva SO2202]